MRVDTGSFEELYASASDGDPWRFDSSPYELDKYATTIANLGRDRYRRCFEPGCSIGVLTERLAARAERVVACDVSQTAIAVARRRLASVEGVELVAASVPEWWPDGDFDLIVLSDFGYYWDRDGLDDIVESLRTRLRPASELVAVHWLGHSDDHLLGGHDVHERLVAGLGPSQLHLEPPPQDDDHGEPQQFVLDRWTWS
ncbi:MAG: methyltransferase domain-containing protein [Actinobacteria bacterium]|nr:methyltransferase domain-containing protein [Actinomycetota bacterium]